MTDLTLPPKKSRFRALRHNPVAMKELRSRMRGRRAFVVLTIYLLAMSAFVSLVYAAYASSANTPYGPDARVAGKAVFAGVLLVQGFMVLFVGPSFTVGAITGEKERQTYDLLRTTLLGANTLVLGKLISALSYVFLLLIASIPLQSIAFLLGGVAVEEVVVSQLVMLVAAVTFALWGLFCSSVMRSTQAASVATFAGALFMVIGIPIIAFFFLIFGGVFFSMGITNWQLEVALVYVALLLAATNLPATLVTSAVILQEESAVFFFQNTFGGTHTVWFPSPWPIFLALYILLALLLYWLSVRRVQRIADK